MSLRLKMCASTFAACASAACSSGTKLPGTAPDTTLGDAATGDGATGALDAESPDSPLADVGIDAGDDSAVADSGDSGVTVDADDTGSLQGDAVDDVPNPVARPSVCPTGAGWSTGTLLAVSTTADDQMGAITPDELTIAWAAVAGASVSIMVADRSSSSVPFGTAAAVPMSPGFYAPAKVALSPDGLRLVTVRSDHKSYGVITRASRSVPFTGAPQDGELALINSTATMGELAVNLDDPVMGAHDQTFYYSLYGGGLLDTVLESTRIDTSPWPNGAALRVVGNALRTSGTARRHPTGIAEDDRTLFYWDEVDSTEKAAWRPSATGAFDHIETLGAFRGAVPNANCDKLYYSDVGTGGLDLFVASRL